MHDLACLRVCQNQEKENIAQVKNVRPSPDELGARKGFDLNDEVLELKEAAISTIPVIMTF